MAKEKEAEIPALTLEEYLGKVQVNVGLVASFKYEASKVPEVLEPKHKEDWAKAFEAQSKRAYKE